MGQSSTTLPDTRRTLGVGVHEYQYYSLAALAEVTDLDVASLPVSIKILLENLLRNCDEQNVQSGHVLALAGWTRSREAGDEVPFHPVRILMPDSSGIPLLADLAAMRDAIVKFGGDPEQVNPVIPLDLIVDHSVTIDVAGMPGAAQRNLQLEFERNGERYTFLRWAQKAFDNLRIVPPGNGICHQINLERLAKVVWTSHDEDGTLAYSDAIVGMDSHTAMINSLGVIGWGVGGIEAATAMLGQPIGIQVPRVIGCRLVGRLRPGVTTTDLVLTVAQRLRMEGVVGAFVEFCGPGVATLALPERATLSNMCPEYGATTTMFPIDVETLRYLTLTGRDPHHVQLVEAYAKAQGLWRDATTPEPLFTGVIEIDLVAVEPSAAGPRRPQDGVPLIIVAGSDYGVGSSRDWAAKGTRMLGIRAVIAESFERIHRSNLIGMGVLPLQFPDGVTRHSLRIDGSEQFDITGLEEGLRPHTVVSWVIARVEGGRDTVKLLARLDTAREIEWYAHGGMLTHALRALVDSPRVSTQASA